MKTTVVILVLLLLAPFLRADVRLFRWQESRDTKTGEIMFGFLLAPRAVMEVIEADAKGDSGAAKSLEGKPANEVWDYAIVLKGDAKIYPTDKLELFEPKPCGSVLQVDSGFVEVDRKAETVRVALTVIQDGRSIDFIANGVYPIKRAPNHSPEPTTGAVH